MSTAFQLHVLPKTGTTKAAKFKDAVNEDQLMRQAKSIFAANLVIAALSALIAARTSAAQITIWNDSSGMLTHETLDLMAKDILNQAQALSFQNRIEYCGYIAYDNLQTLHVTRPIAGKKESCLPPKTPLGWKLVSSYHTHGAIDPKRPNDSFELPSSNDIQSDFTEQVDGYLATPGGRLWFIEGDEKIAYMIGGPGTMLMDPNYQFEDCAPLQSYSIDELRWIEDRSIKPCEL